MRLPEDDARRLLLVRAIEAEDPTATLLTREDRDHATGAALVQSGDHGDGAAFLASRARFAMDRLTARYPAVAQVERCAAWPSWIDPSLAMAALLLGWASNEVFDGRRLNVLSFPLLGMLVWNLSVYALLLITALRSLVPRPDAAPAGPVARLIARAAQPLRQPAGSQPTVARGLARFVNDWARFTGPLNGARARRTMHLGAAALAAGTVLAMYASGWDVEYRAGWESTWIRDPATLHALLSTVLGPASFATGIALPTVAELPALDWGAGRPGVPAAPWIHLYAATALLFIIGPRLLLAGLEAGRVARGRQRVRVPGTEDFYVRTLLRSVEGGGAAVRVVPYSFNVPDDAQRNLRRLLTDVLGERTRVTIEPPISYGGEDDWLAGAGIEARDDDYIVLLFNLSATPEAENHGALVGGVQRRLAEAKRDAVVAVVLDEAGMRRNLASAGETRLESRREAWRAMLRPYGAEPTAIDLGSDNIMLLGQTLEAGLTRSTVGRAA